MFYLVPAMVTVKINAETIFDTVAEMKEKLEGKMAALKEEKKTISKLVYLLRYLRNTNSASTNSGFITT